MQKKSRYAAIVAVTGLALAVLTSAPAAASKTPAALDATRCAALAGTEIRASDIDLPTRGAVVRSAEWVVQTNGQCRVKGDIRPVDTSAPAIQFQVNLPDNWNRRAMQMGGGGLNGTLVDATGSYRYQPPGQATPLQNGFVTLGSDGGHQGAGGSFALNDEALLNYGQQSIKKTHDTAMALIQRAYAKKPKYFYFVGFSQGGHEALDAAGRYPDDYDGVVAGTPAYNVAMMHIGVGSVYRDALYANDGAGWVDPAKQTLLVDAVYAACDPIDGLADGIISDTAGCLDVFDVQALRCPGGADTGDTCLSDAQIATLDTLASYNDTGFDFAGNSVAPPIPLYNGALLTKGRYTLGLTPQPHNPATAQDAWNFQVLDTQVKYMITKDPTADTMNVDLAAYRDRIEQLATIMDTTSVDFTRAKKKGVKVLLYTGMADDGISPYNTIQFYDRLVSKMGKKSVDGFLKFYTIPGMAHGFGPFVAGFESFPALQAWVERGIEPKQLSAVDTVAATAGRTRPVCEYPMWPQYTGSDPDDAGSFTCVTDTIPVNTRAPSISGTPVVGQRLTADPGEWTGEGLDLAYQWLREGKPIAHATQASYKAQARDQGKRLTVRVIATGSGQSAAATSEPVLIRHRHKG